MNTRPCRSSRRQRNVRSSTAWWLPALLLATALPTSAIDRADAAPPFDLAALLECRSGDQLATALESVSGEAEARGFSCRTVSTPHRHSLTCTSERRFTILGAAVREFTLSQPGDGSASLAVALSAATARIEKALAERQTVEPAAGVISVDQREDGAAELRCQRAASASHDGAISGRLSFRGVEPLPAMRVCAAATTDPANPTCVNSQPGDRQYRVSGLAGGRYFLTAFPLSGNPNRLFVVHATGRSGCADGDPRCATARLQPVELRAGQHRDGIDLETLLPQLPASMGRRDR